MMPVREPIIAIVARSHRGDRWASSLVASSQSTAVYQPGTHVVSRLLAMASLRVLLRESVPRGYFEDIRSRNTTSRPPSASAQMLRHIGALPGQSRTMSASQLAVAGELWIAAPPSGKCGVAKRLLGQVATRSCARPG